MRYNRRDPHAALQHQMTMKILTQVSFPHSEKGVRGDLKELRKNRIPNPLPLSKGRGIKKTELKRLPRRTERSSQ